MNELTIYQKTTQPFTIELEGEGTITAVEAKVFKFSNGAKVLSSKHKYPLTTGWNEITKDGDNYTLTLTAAITATMEGAYGIEVIYTANGQPFGGQDIGITVLTAVE